MRGVGWGGGGAGGGGRRGGGGGGGGAGGRRGGARGRRAGGAAVDAGEIEQPPFLINTRNRTLEKNGQRIKLTQVEYSIMKMFMENPGKALSREEILDLVWGHDYFGELKIVDVNIRRLRLKIEDNATNPTYITTVWGYGYKWGF